MSDALLEAPARCVGLVINAPAVFARHDFMAWLRTPGQQVFTWHDRAETLAGEYSDVIVLVDANYDGDSSDMPEDVWKAICEAVYAEYGGPDIPQANRYAVAVRLTNLA